MRVDRLLGAKGIRKDSAAGLEQFASRMEIRCRQEQSAEYEDLRRAWCLGSEEFRQDYSPPCRNAWGRTILEASDRRAENKKPSAS